MWKFCCCDYYVYGEWLLLKGFWNIVSIGFKHTCNYTCNWNIWVGYFVESPACARCVSPMFVEHTVVIYFVDLIKMLTLFLLCMLWFVHHHFQLIPWPSFWIWIVEWNRSRVECLILRNNLHVSKCLGGWSLEAKIVPVSSIILFAIWIRTR